MIRIAITFAAFDAVVATLPFGSTPYEPQPHEKGERVIWLDESVAKAPRRKWTRRELQRRHFAALRDGDA
jgi:hypothetical protein